MLFSSEMKMQKSADRQNNRNSKYEPTDLQDVLATRRANAEIALNRGPETAVRSRLQSD